NDLKLLAERYHSQNDADFIIVQEVDGYILAHTYDENMVGEKIPFDDGYLARVYGGFYNLESAEFVDKSLMGKAPVLSESGSVLGVISVGYLKSSIIDELLNRIDNVLYMSIFVIIVGIIASF